MSDNKYQEAGSKPILSHIFTCVRIKPLGAGAGDIEHPNDKFANKRLDGFDAQKHEITIGDTKTKRAKVYTFPKFVAPPEYTQAKTFSAKNTLK